MWMCVFAPFYGTAGSLYMFLNDLIVWLAVCTCFYAILWCGWQFVRVFNTSPWYCWQLARVFSRGYGTAGSLYMDSYKNTYKLPTAP